MLTVLAPAKINLTLEVLAKRPDGFHEIRSVIQAISLCDSLHLESSRKVAFKSDMSGWLAGESLVSKAVTLLQQATGCSKGVTIEVAKRIPLMAGLGGDSSDAAAILRGLNQLWELNLPLEKLLELAGQLGSDVSFFLYGGTALLEDLGEIVTTLPPFLDSGTALLEGRGEVVTPLPPLPHSWLVLAMPPVPPLPGKTRQLYESLKANHYTDGQITRRMVNTVKKGKPLSPSLLFNTFENVAFDIFPGLGTAREHFIKIGATDVHLAGSGPALFTIVTEKSRAEALYSLLQGQRMTPFLAETVSPSDVT